MRDHLPRLSVIVPVFNETGTIDAILHRLAETPYPHPEQQIVVIDDGSTDGTGEKLARWAGVPGLTLVTFPANRGKGAAVRAGLGLATGRITVVQDADLEYDPADLPALVEVIESGACDAAYGSRYLRQDPTLPWTRFRLAVAAMNRLVAVLYGVRLTDVNTCYKAMHTELYRGLALECERFEFCAEVTAKLLRNGYQVLEVPVSYRPRTHADGKKIGWRDAADFAKTLIVWRIHLPKTLRFHLGKRHAADSSSIEVGCGLDLS